MYKITVDFDDFNGVHREQTLYFSLNKPEIIKLLKKRPTLQDELEKMATRLSKKEPDTSLYVDFITMVDDFIRLSYGIKTESGNFRKNADILDDFTSSAAYDALFTKLLNEPKEFDALMEGIFPADVMTEELQKQIKEEQSKIFGKTE